MVIAAPEKIAEWAVQAASCVPLIKEVIITILEADKSETKVTLDELRARAIPIKPVPRLLHVKAGPGGGAPHAASSSGGTSSGANGASSAEAAGLRQQVAAQAAHNQALEAQIAELKALMAAAKNGIEEAAAAAAPTEPAENAARGKRARQ